jgi:hypothetical protein
MHLFHKILERSLVLTFVLCFMFVSVYTPQPFNQIPEAEAGGVTGGSTWMQQAIDNVTHVANNVSLTASQAYNGITANATASSWYKENVLDGLAWAFAKQVISQMTTSIINWINSGFKGSPNFVTDLEGFLLNIADQTIGSYIQELGGPLSFICSPFQLDIRIALTTNYVQAREGQVPSCTLSGALANIESFVAGNFEDGGWEAWFKITSQPQTYTPYGNLLAAEAQASVRILNAQGQETKILDFGAGFLSTSICETVHGAGTTEENCFISTPGKVVQEALTFQLSTGPESLIAADEFNEIISALFAQLAQQAITGAAGLLGLSQGTGYTYPGFTGGSYANQAGAGTVDAARLRQLITSALATESRYLTAAQVAQVQITAYIANTANFAGRRDLAQRELDKIAPLIVTLNSNITQLTALLAQYNALGTNPTAGQMQPILSGYSALRVNSDPTVDAAIANWENILRP